jgi:hypothetical protein
MRRLGSTLVIGGLLSAAWASDSMGQPPPAPESSAPPLPSATAAEAPGHEPPGAPDLTELAKAAQNPVSNLVSFPFQFNFSSGGSLDDETALNVNFQPVIPVTINDDWRVIARTIVPYVSAPTADTGRIRGLGDVQAQLFLTPAHHRALLWGVGPVLSFPTATVENAVTGSWAAGPGVVLVYHGKAIVAGLLANQLWTYADRGSEHEVKMLTVQPFINLNFKGGWALATAPTITADWERGSRDQWTLPLGLGVTRTLIFAKQPMNIGVQYYHSVVRPEGAPPSLLRLVVSLLVPG